MLENFRSPEYIGIEYRLDDVKMMMIVVSFFYEIGTKFKSIIGSVAVNFYRSNF